MKLINLLNTVAKYVPADKVNNFLHDLDLDDEFFEDFFCSIHTTDEEIVQVLSFSEKMYMMYKKDLNLIDENLDFVIRCFMTVDLDEKSKSTLIRIINDYEDQIINDDTLVENILNSDLVHWSEAFKDGYIQNVDSCVYEDSILPNKTVKKLFLAYAEYEDWYCCTYDLHEFCKDYKTLCWYVESRWSSELLNEYFVPEDIVAEHLLQHGKTLEDNIEFNGDEVADIFIQEGRWDNDWRYIYKALRELEQNTKAFDDPKEYIQEIHGITLLSIEEYEANKDVISHINNDWWLRSQGNAGFSAFVDGNESELVKSGRPADFDLGVRPVLIYTPKSSNLNRGDKIQISNYKWTVLSDNLILCDKIVGHTCFREDRDATFANNYDASDIKAWLNNWFLMNDIKSIKKNIEK